MTSGCSIISPNTEQAQQPALQAYTSPVVQTMQAHIQTMPADSIPVSYSIKGGAIAPTAFVPMMGKWASSYDSNEVVHFTPGRYTSYYKGEKVVEEQMTYYEVCPDNCATTSTQSACFILSSDFGQTCFSILKHTSTTLELQMIGSADQTLVFSKID